MDTKSLGALPKAKLRFIEPMYALSVQKLPEGKEWLDEVKFDGCRCLAGRDSTRVTLWSRWGNLFTNQFPQIARACKRLPPGTLVDGEIVALDENGRVSFNLLQHHRSIALLRVRRSGLPWPEPLERTARGQARNTQGNL
jgi:ATP-dependent DNA ligase